MSTTIKYAYLKQQTWLYRRNYPKHLQPVLGLALKQSLRTGDARVAKSRVIDANARFVKIVSEAEAQVNSATQQPVSQGVVIRVSAPRFQRATMQGQTTVSDLARVYLRKRSQELSPGTFKSVRFSLALLVSVYGGRKINSLFRTDGQGFLKLIAMLSPDVGKSAANKGHEPETACGSIQWVRQNRHTSDPEADLETGVSVSSTGPSARATSASIALEPSGLPPRFWCKVMPS